MDMQLKGKRALVTGSSSGIGAEIAGMLAAEGVKVVVHGRDQARTQAVATEIETARGQAATSVSIAAVPLTTLVGFPKLTCGPCSGPGTTGIKPYRFNKEKKLCMPRSCQGLGIRYETPAGNRKTLESDLIVDASGNGSLTVEFLKTTHRKPLAETSMV
jgi:hypothetical protein